jgi:phage N-6-adenine-methyltransferase
MPNEGMNKPGPSNDEYETPDWLFKALDTEFGFTLDGAATEGNAKCVNYIRDISHQIWNKEDRVYCNPPYSEITAFVVYGLLCESKVVVLLLPVRTDTSWFQMLQESPRVEIRWLRKRIHFELDGKPVIDPKTGNRQSPRFASMIAIVRPR